jgi:hypothetical protein
VEIFGGDSDATSATGNVVGGYILIEGGDANPGASGGDIGGNVDIMAGNGVASGSYGGDITLTPGNGTTRGSVYVISGDGFPTIYFTKLGYSDGATPAGIRYNHGTSKMQYRVIGGAWTDF